MHQGVIFGKRVEIAFEEIFKDCPSVLDDPLRADDVAHRATDHILAHMGMLRDLKDESGNPGKWTRRFPKTGGFRRLMTPQCWEWLSPLLAAMATTAPTGQASGMEEMDGAPIRGDEGTEKVHCDADGFPTIFARILGKHSWLGLCCSSSRQ